MPTALPKSKIKSLLRASSVFALALVSSGGAAAAEQEVVFASPTTAGVNLANITAAMELGYFAKEGLKVTIQEFQGSSIVMSQVAVKSILIGGGGGEPLVVANQPGKPHLPLKFFYNSMRNYIWQFVVAPNSPVTSLAGLKGKRIGVSSLANSHMPISRLILKENGLAPADMQFIAIGVGNAAFRALMNGQVDAYNTYNGNIAIFEATGARLKRLPLPAQFTSLFSYGYFVHEDTLKTQPQTLVGFGRAIAKGTLVCKVAAEWCVKTFWKYYPTLQPREAPEQELARQVQILKENMKAYLEFAPGQRQRFGEFPPGAWKALIDVLYAGGGISTAAIDPQAFYSNDLVDRMNDFDAAAVESAALRLK